MGTTAFPRTSVAGVSLPRMIIGSNWMCGYSHTGPAADHMIKRAHSGRESIAGVLEVFLHQGIDAVMGLTQNNPLLLDGIKLAQDNTGKKLILIDEPVLNVDDNPIARREAEAAIAFSAKAGATFCMPLHSCTEQLLDKNILKMHRLPDYLKMIRDHGMIPGLSAHMPELIISADQNDYDVETYIQIYNCMGFLMQVEIEYISRVIWNAKKPVMTIKPMAAGRCTPYVGLNFAWATLRPQDMVTVGCMTPEEAQEDIEISLAAFEHRLPQLEGRASPQKTQIMK